MLNLEFDPKKNEKNISERGISFELVYEFDWQSAWIWQDIRKIYPEVRYCALGYINSRLYALVFTETALGIRVISLRKANKREVKKYEQNL